MKKQGIYLYGPRGCGKTRLAEALLAPFRDDEIVRRLPGGSNRELHKARALVLDAAGVFGDSGRETRLKWLLTSPTLVIEHPGEEPVSVPNKLLVILEGTEPLPDELARRFVQIDVSTAVGL